MAERSHIEWTDSTFNPWIGCTKVSPACDHCYAEAQMDHRLGRARWGAGQPRVRTSAAYWRKPLKWNCAVYHQCIACGWRGEDHELADPGHVCPACGGSRFTPARRRVFCASLADVFDNEVPTSWRVDLFDLIRATPDLDWLLLTKRIGNAVTMMDEAGGWSGASAGAVRNPLPNVWIGATIANQAEADRDIPKLLQAPAAVRFLSCEPLLGQVQLRWEWVSRGRPLGGGPMCNLREPWKDPVEAPAIDWVIAGGESGPHARPMHPDWARLLRDQCEAAGVPFLFKQWGEWWQYVNEDHYTYCGEERKPHAWVDRDTGKNGLCWLVDDDGSWSNYTGEPPMQEGDQVSPSVSIMGYYGKKAAGRLLDDIEHNGFPKKVQAA